MSSNRAPRPTNLAIVVGVLSRPPAIRVLASGSTLVSLDLTVRRPGAPTETVPVAWFDAPAWASELDVDEALVVVGRVRRRFFRGGRGTESRTEVTADTVVPARQPKRASAAIRAALAQLPDAA